MGRPGRTRRSGSRSCLIGAVADWAADRGCSDVYLFVQETNVRAQRVYERAGFRPTGAQGEACRDAAGFKLLYTAPVDALVQQPL